MSFGQHSMPERAFATRSRLRSSVVNGALVLAAGLLLAAFFAPLLTLKRMVIFSDTITLVSALASLAGEGQLALFALLLAFSVLFPIAKIGCLFYVWNHGDDGSTRARRALRWLARLGKWSMLDVFVVALLVVGVKLRWVADVEVRFGLYLFGGSVLLTMLLGDPIARQGQPPAITARSGGDVVS